MHFSFLHVFLWLNKSFLCHHSVVFRVWMCSVSPLSCCRTLWRFHILAVVDTVANAHRQVFCSVNWITVPQFWKPVLPACRGALLLRPSLAPLGCCRCCACVPRVLCRTLFCLQYFTRVSRTVSLTRRTSVITS